MNFVLQAFDLFRKPCLYWTYTSVVSMNFSPLSLNCFYLHCLVHVCINIFAINWTTTLFIISLKHIIKHVFCVCQIKVWIGLNMTICHNYNLKKGFVGEMAHNTNFKIMNVLTRSHNWRVPISFNSLLSLGRQTVATIKSILNYIQLISIM